MKNNRSLSPDIIERLIIEHKLSKDPPPPDSLFWKMWNACTSIAKQALNTTFIQSIRNANLDPVTYGGFNVSDAYYCFKGADDYLTASNKAIDSVLKLFLLEKYQHYQKYNEDFPTIWHIKDASGVVPNKVIKEYSDFETAVVRMEDPIYSLIVMLPCEYLWAWLGAQLNPPKPGNLYAPWINGNNYPDGAYTMGNFLNDYQQKHYVDEAKAIEIYTQAMNFEYQNFAIATHTNQ